MKKNDYDSIAVSLKKLCCLYNSTFYTDDRLQRHYISLEISGFCRCLDSLGINWRFSGGDTYESLYLDGLGYVVQEID